MSLSAVVITHNEVKRIGACLDSLRQVSDDLIVVDSGSTDATEAICLAKGARFFRRAWDGYSPQKNFGNAQARHPWVISLDADEELSPELIASIQRQFAAGVADYDAFSLPFITNFCGQWIRHGGWNPEQHVRLFDQRRIQWNLDAVHEGLTLRPEHRIGRLTGHVRHYTVDTLAQFYAKTERYSQLFAQRNHQAGKRAGWVKTYLSPAFRLLAEFVFKRGFLDGRAGWIIARENARYTYLKYKKLTQLNRAG
jgi:glycosyltransferase involved in cell wall biosynthesis